MNKHANTFANHHTPYTYETNIRWLFSFVARLIPSFALLVALHSPPGIDLLIQPSFNLLPPVPVS